MLQKIIKLSSVMCLVNDSPILDIGSDNSEITYFNSNTLQVSFDLGIIVAVFFLASCLIYLHFRQSRISLETIHSLSVLTQRVNNVSHRQEAQAPAGRHRGGPP